MLDVTRRPETPSRSEVKRGWTETIALRVAVQQVERSGTPLPPNAKISVIYEIDHRGHGWVGPILYRPPVLKRGSVRTMYLLHKEGTTFTLAAEDMSFERPPPGCSE